MIKQHSVVTLNYKVQTAGELIDQSPENEPLVVIIGLGQLIPGLESELMGKQTSDKFEVEIEAVNAYGERSEDLLQAVPVSMFGEHTPEPGMQFRATTDQGEQSVMILAIEGEEVIIDGNHPLSGLDLKFNVEIIDVREATAEEIEHGHVHSEGGCGHQH
ncbi:peptidylprolyl isomerase [Alginatibacterium sediminis]|uniref:Peptidyl-prolyl cis-trans isomerase n=1 Tax=Alginatibacterium sediminis TaxID=2164068 RepID=A0A420EHT6_9ALTE|nr:peptidylprolyl isomerase [Alginatibacterium sediminis]RKF20220.1 peptidylprolyl isomerase [Alginatibacterium sediminis]